MIPNTSIEPDAILSEMGALNLRALVAPEPGGFVANSRWLRSAATTPPVVGSIFDSIPEGWQRSERLRVCDRVTLRSLRDRENFWKDRSGGVARSSRNPRLLAVIPSG